MYQRHFTSLTILVFLSACGLSQQERTDIAAVTCSIMSESRNMDGALRIKEINEARAKLGSQAFVDGDQKIRESFRYGLCEKLVLNETYEESLASLKKIEREIEEEDRRKEEEKRRKKRELRSRQLEIIAGYQIRLDSIDSEVREFERDARKIVALEADLEQLESERKEIGRIANEYAFAASLETDEVLLEYLQGELEIIERNLGKTSAQMATIKQQINDLDPIDALISLRDARQELRNERNEKLERLGASEVSSKPVVQ